MITFSHIYKSYNDKELISDFNLTIESGTFLTIIGTSGSGKTTLLKMINGLILPDKGEIHIDGRNILAEDLIELRRNIGYVIQGNILFPHLAKKLFSHNCGYARQALLLSPYGAFSHTHSANIPILFYFPQMLSNRLHPFLHFQDARRCFS